MNEDDLEQIFDESGKYKRHEDKISAAKEFSGYNNVSPLPAADGKLCQWASKDGKIFTGASNTAGALVPGLYDIGYSPETGMYFEKLAVKTEGLLRFPHTNSDIVLAEIQKFWERKQTFLDYNLTHKRGILLYGPPGSGKSSLIQLITHDLISRNGIAIRFNGILMPGIRIFREIQPETPIVVIMEDLDSIIEQNPESAILNILDGVELIHHVVFLATTNYPEKLGPRIVNRPSRFDKRIKIGHPTPESRLVYLQHLVHDAAVDLNKWVADTEGFSFAHLRELFIAVLILEDSYEDALATLKTMRENISSSQDSGGKVGFGF